ncbi:MAG TPA: polyprenyl synthetase family protein, partial [Clostridia bacterium]|nr:polyprenyl synthetase family protein [Clostridia bacterium]
MNFKEQLNDYIELINTRLSGYLDYEKGYNSTLIESMKYSLFAGGKRLRPVLALASYDLFGDDIREVTPYACALEMIHTYSLIHDDLPAMDNDDYRRGKLTNHKVYGEGIAILAGDGLLSYAFEIMLDDASKQKQPCPYIQSIKEIANAIGISGMIAGQTVDLESEN